MICVVCQSTVTVYRGGILVNGEWQREAVKICDCHRKKAAENHRDKTRCAERGCKFCEEIIGQAWYQFNWDELL